MTVYVFINGWNHGQKKKKEKSRIQSEERKFMRHLRGFTKAGKIRNETLRSYLNTFSINK